MTGDPGCTGKERYAKRAVASRVLDRMRKRGQIKARECGKLVLYHCPTCDGWHLGHDRRA